MGPKHKNKRNGIAFEEFKNDGQARAARHALQGFKIISSHAIKRIASGIAIFKGLELFIAFVLITYG